MTSAKILGIASFLPESVEENLALSREFPDWDMQRIIEKIGIEYRHVAKKNESSSSLAIAAAEKVLSNLGFAREHVDFLILVSQTPDFLIPPNSSLVHFKLGLRAECGSVDIGQGCSGYVSALGLAKALIESGQHRNILLVTTDTYSKLISADDRSVRPIFGDGATATIVTGEDHPIGGQIGEITSGFESSNYEHLIAPNSGMSVFLTDQSNSTVKSVLPRLEMNGKEIFNFTLRIAKPSVDSILEKAGLRSDDIDYFVFHQANSFVLENLQRTLSIPAEKVQILMKDFGNTVSSSIPMALEILMGSKKIHQGSQLVLFGFGVGLTWAGTTITF